MNRRELLKSIGLSTVALPLLSAASNFTSKAIQPSGLNFKFGDLDLFLFSDGTNILKEPFPLIAPNKTEKDFLNATKECYLDQQPIAFSLNILLIKKGEKYILFDTGNGLGKNENVGKLLEQMQATNIPAHLITDVILTHAHGDHIGGILLPDGSYAFKNANYYIGQKEFDFWMQENNQSTKNILEKIQTKLNFIKQDDILFDCIKTVEIPGHTPGHLAFEITQNGKVLKHIADAVHSPILIRYPEYGIKYDRDFDLAVSTRIKVLEEAYQKRQIIVAMHLPWPGIGYIGKRDGKYDWIPLSFGSNLKQIQL